MNLLLILLAVIAGGEWFLLITVVTAPTTKHGKPRMPVAAASALLAACLAVCGCKTTAPLDTGSKLRGSSLSTALAWLGIEDPPPPPPLDIDVLCDASAGSSCTAESLRATLDVLLPATAARPSSLVRLWVLGRDVADTTQIATVTADAKARNAKSEQARRVRLVEESRNTLMSAVTPYLGQHMTRSPIAESLAKINMVHTRIGASRLFIVITDAREFSGLGDFECRPPQPTAFTTMLDANHILAPKSLAGAGVVFSYVTLARIDHDRCPASVGSAEQVEAVWDTALRRAGAAEVEFEAGTPMLNRIQMEGGR
jgi:hypothetical protein